VIQHTTTWIGVALAGAGLARGQEQYPPPRPVAIVDEGYVGSSSCRSCHRDNHASWQASYHRSMTQVASASAILAPFEGVTPALEGTAWRLERDSGEFFVTPLQATGGEGLAERSRVVLTTGSHHYQIYWLEDRGSGMEQLPLIWHRDEGEWVPRKSMFVTPPSPYSGEETGRWQRTCIQCHATNGTQEHPEQGGARVAEFGISCESCHGPGEAHVTFHGDEERSDTLEPGAADPTIVNPKRLSHQRSAEICGQCHGIHPLPKEERKFWQHQGFGYRPGQVLSESRHLLRGTYEKNGKVMQAFLRRHPDTLQDHFWSDGEVRLAGREYNGLIESPCFQRGELSCISCHDLHRSRQDPRNTTAWADDQLAPGMDGPKACLQCHEDYRDPVRWSTHTHHASDSTGSNCLNCHMPYTSYGLTKAIRSHTVTTPSVANALKAEKPLACNLCHLDRSLGWSADHLAQWYDHERPELNTDLEEVAASVLWALRGNAGLRALSAWTLGWPAARQISGTGWMPYLFSTLLMDPYDAVRWTASQSHRRDPGFASFRLDFTQHIEEQRNRVREEVLSEWLRTGLDAQDDQRRAVLVRPDGTLDEERFRRIYAQRDRTPISLQE
jgi:hypothetical protein